MKEKQENDRTDLLVTVSDCLKGNFVSLCLMHKLSPNEMLTVLGILTFTICKGISETYNSDLPTLLGTFNYILNEMPECVK